MFEPMQTRPAKNTNLTGVHQRSSSKTQLLVLTCVDMNIKVKVTHGQGIDLRQDADCPGNAKENCVEVGLSDAIVLQ